MPSAMSDDLFSDLLLEPEQQYYEEGFREGQAQSTVQPFHEGKQLGVQTGFQRFLILGALRKLVKFLQEDIDAKRDGDMIVINGRHKDYRRTSKQLDQLANVLDCFFEEDRLIVKNTDQEVADYSKLLKQGRAKARSLCVSLGYPTLYRRVEETCRQVSGDIPASTDTW